MNSDHTARSDERSRLSRCVTTLAESLDQRSVLKYGDWDSNVSDQLLTCIRDLNSLWQSCPYDCLAYAMNYIIRNRLSSIR